MKTLKNKSWSENHSEMKGSDAYGKHKNSGTGVNEDIGR